MLIVGLVSSFFSQVEVDKRLFWHVAATLQSGAVKMYSTRGLPPFSAQNSSQPREELDVTCMNADVWEPDVSSSSSSSSSLPPLAAALGYAAVDDLEGSVPGFLLSTRGCDLHLHNTSDSVVGEPSSRLIGFDSYEAAGCVSPPLAQCASSSSASSSSWGSKKQKDNNKGSQCRSDAAAAANAGHVGLRIDARASPANAAANSQRGIFAAFLPGIPPAPEKTLILTSFNLGEGACPPPSGGADNPSAPKATPNCGSRIDVYTNRMTYTAPVKADPFFYVRIFAIVMVVPLFLWWKFRSKPAGGRSSRGRSSAIPSPTARAGGNRATSTFREKGGASRRGGSPMDDLSSQLDGLRGLTGGVQSKMDALDKISSEIEKLSSM